MSWEEMYTHSNVCLCGKGKLYCTAFQKFFNIMIYWA